MRDKRKERQGMNEILLRDESERRRNSRVGQDFQEDRIKRVIYEKKKEKKQEV